MSSVSRYERTRYPTATAALLDAKEVLLDVYHLTRAQLLVSPEITAPVRRAARLITAAAERMPRHAEQLDRALRLLEHTEDLAESALIVDVELGLLIGRAVDALTEVAR